MLIDGKPVSTGGIDHDAIKNALLDAAKTEAEKVKILEAFIEDENHVFVDKDGNWYSRDDASTRLGEEKPLQSSRLAELKAPKPPEAAPAPAPATVPAAPAAPEPLFGGEPLSYWEANASKGEVPKGDERAKLAKYLAVPNQPTKILNALKDTARTKRIHAPEPKPEELAGMPPTEPPPVPPEPTPTRVSKPHIITREMEQALADLGYTKKQRNGLTPEQAQDIIAKQEKAPAVTPAPKPVTPVTPAVAKVEQEVKQVAQTEGQRSAKEVKSELVSSIEQAIEAAPANAEFDSIRGTPLTDKAKKAPTSITIDIPGDGTFTPLNRKENLTELLVRAKRISTSAQGAPKVPTRKGSPELADEVEKVIQAYGSAEAAYRSAKRQRDALPDNDPETPKKVEAADILIQALYEKTKASEYEAKGENARKLAETYRAGQESFQKGIDKLRAIKRQTAKHRAEIISLEERLAENKKRTAQYEKEAEQFEQLAAKEKAALEAEPKSMGPGAAAAAEFDEARPSAAAMGLNAGNPLLNRLQVRADNFIRGIKQLFARSPIKQDISQLANAADNIPRVAGQTGGNSIRLRATEAERHAITYLMGALKMSGEGLSVEDAARLGELEFAGDPIGYLRTKQADMETAAQVFLNNGKRLEAQAAIDAAKHLALAREKYNQLLPIARRVRNQFDSQIQREHRWGINTEYQNWYTPGRYELDLMTGSNRPIIFGEHRGSGVTTTFKKAKVFEDYPEAIEKGFVPRSTDIANLLEHRIVQGERLIQRKSLYNQLRAVRDPIDQNPLVIDIPKRRITRPDGTTDVQESVPRGYTPHEVIPGVRVAVHDGYSPLMKALTATSTQISESAIVGTLQDIAAIEKHIGLALDTFHASRVLQTELMLTGKISVGAHLKRGLALVEFKVEDLNLAVEKGLITQDMANWVRNPRPIEVNGRTVRLSPHMMFVLGAKNGLNMARVSDVLYRDWLRQIPITGTVNKWVFDKATRSAMSQAYLMEFERVAKNNPHLSATRVARVAASDINLMFGNLQKESIFKNPSVTAINSILFLAPRWVESLVKKELRFGRQLGQAGRDIVRGRPVGAPIPIEGTTGGGTFQRMTHFPQMGTVAKGMGTGIAAYFVATQLLNLYTRGHFTFENPEEGHKLDAWIPDFTGKTKGFFISPLSVFGEISHDIIRLSEARPDFASVLQQIAQNKLGNFGRFLQVVAAGRDPMTNEKLIGTANRAMKAGIQLIPVPISLSQVSRAAAAEVAPTLVSPPAPGSTQRQISASMGFKTEPASTAQNQVFRFADAWKKSSSNKTLKAQVERRLKEDFGPSEYKDLRTALIRKDLDAARRAYNVLLESKDPRVIRQTMGHPHPFTGSLHNERAFIFSLNTEQRKVYREAVNERRQMYTEFLRMLRETHR